LPPSLLTEKKERGNMYKGKKIKKSKIKLTVSNVTKLQLDTLRLELKLMSEPWRRQGVRISLDRMKKVS
jgi:aryl carrier-like protein